MSSSIGSVSSSQYQNYQTDNSKDQFKQDMQAIQTALQSGDVAGAQDAFAKLKDMQQQRESKKGSSNNGSNPMQKDMQSLQDALGSGNLQDAQNAFAQLQTDMKAHGGHHGHHMQSANGASSMSQSTATTDSSNQTATTATDARSGASPMYA